MSVKSPSLQHIYFPLIPGKSEAGHLGPARTSEITAFFTLYFLSWIRQLNCYCITVFCKINHTILWRGNRNDSRCRPQSHCLGLHCAVVLCVRSQSGHSDDLLDRGDIARHHLNSRPQGHQVVSEYPVLLVPPGRAPSHTDGASTGGSGCHSRGWSRGS